MLLVMRHSADYTLKSGRAINPSTQAVMDYLADEIASNTEEQNG